MFLLNFLSCAYNPIAVASDIITPTTARAGSENEAVAYSGCTSVVWFYWFCDR